MEPIERIKNTGQFSNQMDGRHEQTKSENFRLEQGEKGIT